MRKNIFFLMMLVAVSCGHVKVTPAPQFDNAPLASPCLLEQAENTVILRDYFPLLAEMDTIVITAAPTEPWLRYLEVKSQGQQAALVLKNRLPEKVAGEDPANAPFITTAPVPGKTDRFYILIENQADDMQVLWQNTLLDKKHGIKVIDRNKLEITVPRNARKMERSYIRAYAANAAGIGNDILVPLAYGQVMRDAKQLKRTDKHAQILYSLMIDRFVNGRTDNDMPLNSPLVNPKVDYWGGDILGVTKTLESGYFDSLGVTTIWLSPITQNPYDAWGQIHDPETKFSGYHGYWPYYATAVDVRYGTEAELRDLLDKAHADKKNVILDYVSNHMHIQSPTLTAHPDWTTPSDTPDGRPNRQLYDEFRLTTWFDDHIPTLDLERPDICAQLTDSALFWMQHFDFDGFRHDATKHVPEQYWRMLTRKLYDSLPGRTFYQIGETYGSTALINSYIKPGMQDAQFDFNVYDTYIWATTRPDGSFEGLAGRLAEDLSVYGSHHLMGNITGNHDRSRYICLASGDVSQDEDQKLAGWHRDIRVTNPKGYRYLEMLHALNFTLPGVPCIYYGDEFGQPGANDPDNRRWMQFEGLTPDERHVLDCTKHLAAMRAGSMALLYGDYKLLRADKDILAYSRTYMGETIVTVLNKGTKTTEVAITLPLGLESHGRNAFTVVVSPLSFAIVQ
jgi:glycosidase